MRKRRVDSESPTLSDQAWLNVQTVATLEFTSEDEGHPIEAALSSRGPQGWRASAPGKQTIRLIFDQPQRLSESTWYSQRPRRAVRRNSSFAGVQETTRVFAKLYGSSGISVLRKLHERRKTIRLVSHRPVECTALIRT
jgi:hypothetical protein